MASLQRTVLVVDDDPDLRESIVAFLGDEGWQALGATDGLDAKRRIESGLQPCVILLDLMMPRMAGQDFLAWLRETPAPTGATPVVVVTAQWKPSVPAAQLVLQKPFSLDQMLGDISRYCPLNAGAAS